MKQNRVDRIMAALKEMGLHQMLIVDPMSIYYLTGVYVSPFERFYGLYLREDGHHAFFLNRLFTVPQEVGIEKVWYSDTDPAMEIVAKYLDKDAPLGVDKELKARFLLPLMEMKAAAGFVNASLAVDNTRGIKDEEEQDLMRISSDINDKAMAQFKAIVHEGVTEKELADQMLKIYMDLGADGYSFEPLVAFGANAADPHHEPDNTVLKVGDCVLFDVGCIRKGYCSDMTRTFFYEGILEEEIKVYEIVKKANEAAEAMIKPGVKLSDIDKCARKVISDEGYGKYFTHRLGHFIGRDVHEYGDVSSVNEMEVEEGMIFSIEPGIYLEGNFGVRVEDLVMVTKDRCQVLNSFTKDIYII